MCLENGNKIGRDRTIFTSTKVSEVSKQTVPTLLSRKPRIVDLQAVSTLQTSSKKKGNELCYLTLAHDRSEPLGQTLPNTGLSNVQR